MRARGVTQVVLTGVATGTGAEAHQYSLAKVFPRLGETGTVDEIIPLLPGR